MTVPRRAVGVWVAEGVKRAFAFDLELEALAEVRVRDGDHDGGDDVEAERPFRNGSERPPSESCAVSGLTFDQFSAPVAGRRLRDTVVRGGLLTKGGWR
jgi:hypothetical protein